MKKPNTIDPLIPRSKVAFYLGVCNRTIRRWEQNKKLTPHVLNSRITAYPQSEVEALISNARQVAAPIA